MPGKYSHSVVLADLSSRGIINLPNDQHVAYLRSSPYPASQRSRHGSNPWSDRSPTSQPRSQSAMAFSTGSAWGTGRVSTPTRQVVIDTDLDGRDRKLVDSGYHQSTTSNQYSTARNTQNSSNPGHSRDTTHTRTTMTPTPDPVAFQQKSISRELRNATTASRKDSIDRIPVAQFLREMPSPPKTIQRQGSGSAKTRATNLRLEPAAEIKPKADNPISNGNHVTDSRNTVSKASQSPIALKRHAVQEIIHSPKIVEDELDFAGFSDAEEPLASYFEPPPSMRPLTAQKSQTQIKANQYSNNFETPYSGDLAARITDARARTSHSISTNTPESEIRDMGTSPLYSHSKLDSLTSLSTISSRGTGINERPGKSADTKKTSNQPAGQDWRLPEIDEDGTFDADFFTQGADDLVPQPSNESVDSFLNRPLGTVSAGRDINFDLDDDAGSEADAACPPDIGRFRGEDDVEPSPFVQKKKSDYLLRTGAGSPIPTSPAKKIGFFARLRSKTKLRE